MVTVFGVSECPLGLLDLLKFLFSNLLKIVEYDHNTEHGQS
jgi:hypothetical protein